MPSHPSRPHLGHRTPPCFRSRSALCFSPLSTSSLYAFYSLLSFAHHSLIQWYSHCSSIFPCHATPFQPHHETLHGPNPRAPPCIGMLYEDHPAHIVFCFCRTFVFVGASKMFSWYKRRDVTESRFPMHTTMTSQDHMWGQLSWLVVVFMDSCSRFWATAPI